MKIIGAIFAILAVVYLIFRFSNRCRKCGSWDTEYDFEIPEDGVRLICQKCHHSKFIP